ncbi:MAG: hypothetical protein EOP11_12460 [Proteobacteria bacterium]|nr:MAG: hypothetical protein EOP11_12460 [Pseudomonadota bacterium]
MGQISLLIFSAFAIITVLSFGVRKQRQVQRVLRLRSLDWERVARSLFHQPSAAAMVPADKLTLILNEVLAELDLNYALIGFHEAGTMRVLHVSSRGYAAPLPFRVGARVPDSHTYAGALKGNQKTIVIDAASLSPWREHPAFQALGWEAYLAVKRPGPGETFLSVACFSTRPREISFTAVEKRFLQDGAAWIERLVQEQAAQEASPQFINTRSERYSPELVTT